MTNKRTLDKRSLYLSGRENVFLTIRMRRYITGRYIQKKKILGLVNLVMETYNHFMSSILSQSKIISGKEIKRCSAQGCSLLARVGTSKTYAIDVNVGD